MVKLEQDYVFEGPDGKMSLLELVEGRRQLIVYHFMFDPAWEKGCVDALNPVDLTVLRERDTSLESSASMTVR